MTLLMLGGMVSLLIVVLLASSTLVGLDAKFASLITIPTKAKTMQTMTTPATNTEGFETVIVTNRNDKESNADFIERHNDLVREYIAS